MDWVFVNDRLVRDEIGLRSAIEGFERRNIPVTIRPVPVRKGRYIVELDDPMEQ
jgi:hypothetical protein